MKKNGVFHRALLFALLTFLYSCYEIDPWKLDAIASEDASYNSARLVYTDPQSHLHVEFLKMGGEIEAFIYLDQYRFAPSPENPKFTEISFKERDLQWMELSPLREGRMRLKLSKKTAERLIYALQEGREVAILAGGFQETIPAGAFKARYSQFLQGSFDFLHSFRGPIE